MDNKKIVSIAVVAIIVVGVGAFYSGTAYQAKKTAASKSQRVSLKDGISGKQKILGDKKNIGQGQISLSGEIFSKDEKSITIKTLDVGSKIIYLSELTQISKSVEGSIEDLNSGQQLMISGKDNSDGSFAANNIQIRTERPSDKN